METSDALAGRIVTIAGDLRDEARVLALIQIAGGIYQKSPVGVDLVITGDDPGSKPKQALRHNPNVTLISEDGFLYRIKTVTTRGEKFLMTPTYVQARRPDSYGDW